MGFFDHIFKRKTDAVSDDILNLRACVVVDIIVTSSLAIVEAMSQPIDGGSVEIKHHNKRRAVDIVALFNLIQADKYFYHLLFKGEPAFAKFHTILYHQFSIMFEVDPIQFAQEYIGKFKELVRTGESQFMVAGEPEYIARKIMDEIKGETCGLIEGMAQGFLYFHFLEKAFLPSLSQVWSFPTKNIPNTEELLKSAKQKLPPRKR